MNKAEFTKCFRSDVMPKIRETERAQGGSADYPLRAETWNNMVDALVTDRELPRVALNWGCPFDKR